MLNKVTLIGRLGRDPETRYMPNGEAVCNFSVATSESWNDRNGQRQERTEWHNITMYRRPEPPRRQAPAATAAPVDDVDDDIPF